MLGLRFCARAFSSCGEWGPLFITVRGPLTVAASLVAEHMLQACRLSITIDEKHLEILHRYKVFPFLSTWAFIHHMSVRNSQVHSQARKPQSLSGDSHPALWSTCLFTPHLGYPKSQMTSHLPHFLGLKSLTRLSCSYTYSLTRSYIWISNCFCDHSLNMPGAQALSTPAITQVYLTRKLFLIIHSTKYLTVEKSTNPCLQHSRSPLSTRRSPDYYSL